MAPKSYQSCETRCPLPLPSQWILDPHWAILALLSQFPASDRPSPFVSPAKVPNWTHYVVPKQVPLFLPKHFCWSPAELQLWWILSFMLIHPPKPNWNPALLPLSPCWKCFQISFPNVKDSHIAIATWHVLFLGGLVPLSSLSCLLARICSPKLHSLCHRSLSDKEYKMSYHAIAKCPHPQKEPDANSRKPHSCCGLSAQPWYEVGWKRSLGEISFESFWEWGEDTHTHTQRKTKIKQKNLLQNPRHCFLLKSYPQASALTAYRYFHCQDY